jgi:hypothetical protein
MNPFQRARDSRTCLDVPNQAPLEIINDYEHSKLLQIEMFIEQISIAPEAFSCIYASFEVGLHLRAAPADEEQ